MLDTQKCFFGQLRKDVDKPKIVQFLLANALFPVEVYVPTCKAELAYAFAEFGSEHEALRCLELHGSVVPNLSPTFLKAAKTNMGVFSLSLVCL